MKLTAKSALGLFHVWVGSSGAKLVRVMKLTTIIILVVCLHSSANGIAQNTVTFSGKDVNLESVFTAIKKQTSYRFFFNTSIIQNASKITIEVKNAPIEQVLNLALKDQSLTFAIKGRTIFVMKKQEEEKKTSYNEQLQNPIDVKGRVVNENGEPIQSVTVTVKGTQYSTSTNSNGEFTMNSIEDNAVLVFTSVNMETFEVNVKGKAFFDVALQTKITSMQEVVINKGYYTEKKKFSTGNVSKVTSKEIELQPVQNPILALQGRVPGLLITQSTGLSGGGVTVRIQGQNSIKAGSDPLYVIDGVPYPSQMLPTTSVGSILGESGAALYSPGGKGNPLSYINLGDIESIEILKDADATSIYGSRAANGAILITTKSGKAGPVKMDVKFQQGWAKITRSMDILNTEQYLEMRKEALANDNIAIKPTDANYDVNGLWDQSRYTDWVKILLGGTAKYTNVNASVSGGNSLVQYLVGTTFQRETTVFPGDFDDKKGSVHFSINSASANKRFRMGITGSYMSDNNQLPQIDYSTIAYTIAPNAPALYNEDGSLNWAPNLVGNSSWDNPMAQMNKIYQNKTDNLISSANLSYTIIKGLELSSRFGYTKLTTNEFATAFATSQKPEKRATYQRPASFSTGIITVFNVEPQINFKKAIGKAAFDILIGTTIQQQKGDGENITGSGYLTDGMVDLRSASSIIVNSTIDTKYKYNAAYSRINFNWQNKYIVNLTARRDGSSRFGMENKFHNFASAGVAWLFSEETFFQKNWRFVSFGKLKASYGTSGSDQIGDYSYVERYIANNPSVLYQGGNSIRTNRITNPYLQWEETRKLSVGLDLGFFNDRFLLSAIYGSNRSSNQLLSYALPYAAGFTSVDMNFPATIQNTTWEISFTSANVKRKAFEWTSSINLTIPKNKLIAFPGIENSSYASSYVVGEPITANKAYIFQGVDPATGLYRFASENGGVTNNPSSSINSPSKLINASPKFYGGFKNNIRYKQFQLDALFQVIKQIQKNDLLFGLSGPPGMSIGNQPTTVLNRWQKTGDNNASVQRYGTDFSVYFNPYNDINNSDAVCVDASYVRLENLSLSYELNAKFSQRLRINRCSFFVSGQNLLTISSFGGIDPENRSFLSTTPLKMYTVGVHLGL